MSVRTMARVWETSAHSGSELLMLLSLADFSDDSGKSYPAVGTLATKCRMTARNANRILAELRQSGELVVRVNEGPRGTNLYYIPLKPLPLLKNSSPLTSAPASPDELFPPPLTPASDEPSLNHHEPPVGFEQFWTAYPKKRSKGKAEQVWKKLKPDALLGSRIIEAIGRAELDPGWIKESGRYIPYPASWLNAKGWEDEQALNVLADDSIFSGAAGYGK